ncbi:MAG TPA: hypothetical protein VGO43_00045 [Pyrinomonadaceae bacterium]|nr:hypothetical protein [Pyrinomonadaceae bacterium]
MTRRTAQPSDLVFKKEKGLRKSRGLFLSEGHGLQNRAVSPIFIPRGAPGEIFVLLSALTK